EQQVQHQAMQTQMSGEGGDIDQDGMKEEIAEVMVGQELLTQAADKEVGEVSEDDLDDTMDEFIEQNQMEDKDDIMDALKEDDDDIMNQLKQQAQVDKYSDQEADISEP